VKQAGRLQPLEPAGNDFAWPPAGWNADADILWLEADPSPQPPAGPAQLSPVPASAAPTSPVPTSPVPVSIPRTEAPGRIPIPDVLARGVPFEWPEAVALVQELGDGLKNSGPSRTLLTLDALALGPDGRLGVSMEPGAVPIVRSLGHVLEQLLTNHPGPANLRLIAMQATADGSTFSSVEELARALAHFERPGRLKALTALYERARAAEPPAGPVAVPPPAKPEVRPETSVRAVATAELENQARVRRSRLEQLRKHGRRVAVGVATVGIAAAVIAVAVWALPQLTSTPRPALEQTQNSPVSSDAVPEPPAKGPRPSGAPAAARSGNATARAQRPAVPKADDSVPVTTMAPAAASVAAAVGQPAAGSQIPPRAEQEFVRARTLFDRKQFADAAAGFQRVIDILSNGELSPSSSTLRSTASELAALSLAAVSNPDQRIYSRIDAGVTEPVPMREFLPREAAAGAAPGNLSVLELVIDTRGFVESVRLQDPQNRYRDRWWLNAAKTWRFQPALKDGQPVRFLKRITIDTF